ncbi:IS110 family transposase, partial [Bacillus cereus]|nr:IS110 family transposase [Bacillus cereus]
LEGIKAPQKSKIMKLAQVACHSIGVTEGQEMAHIQNATFVRRYRLLEHDIQELTNKLTVLAKTSVEYEWLSTIPGLG